MKTLIIFIVILALGLGFWLINGTDREESDLGLLPDVILTQADGSNVKLHDYIGSPLVVNSWAVWYPFCRKELPDFALLQEEFPNIKVIAIDRRESLYTTRTYTDELGITDKLVFLLDPDDTFYKTIGGFSMPETLFVDSQGKIIVHKRGVISLEEMRELVGTIND